MCWGGFVMLEEITSDHKNNVTVPKMFSLLLIQILPLIIEWPEYFSTNILYFVYWQNVVFYISYTRYLTLTVNFGEVRRAQLAKSTLLTSTLVPPGIFSHLLMSVQMLKRVGCRKQREATPHLFIPSKIATLVPAFVRNCSLLGSWVCSKGPALGQNSLMKMMILETQIPVNS